MKKIIPCIISLIILITPLTVHAETVDFNTWSLDDFHKVMCTYYPKLCCTDSSQFMDGFDTYPVSGTQAWYAAWKVTNANTGKVTEYNPLNFKPAHILLFCNSNFAILCYATKDDHATKKFTIDTEAGIMSANLLGVVGDIEYYVFNAQNPYGKPQRIYKSGMMVNADISSYGFTNTNTRLLMINDDPVYITPKLPDQYDVAIPESYTSQFKPGESDFVPDLDPDMQIADILYYLNMINSNVSNIKNLPTFFGSISNLLTTISDSLVRSNLSVADLLYTIKTQLTTVVQKVNNMDKSITTLVNKITDNNTAINSVLSSLLEVVNSINDNTATIIEKIQSLVPFLDRTIVEVVVLNKDVTDRQDREYLLLNKLLQSVDNILLYFTNKDAEKEDTESFSLNISNLANDNSTIFGAAHQLNSQISDFLTTIDGSGTTSFEVGYSTKFVGQNINNKVKIDNSFYSPYKEKGDAFISAFMWLAFIFSFFRNLGTIIEGGGFRIVKHDIIGGKTGDDLGSFTSVEKW